MAYSKRARQHSFETSSNLQPIEKQILKYMHDHHQSGRNKALDIARGIGKKTKKEINKHLYGLQKKGIIKKVLESPPTWELTKYEPNTYVPASQQNTRVLSPPAERPNNYQSSILSPPTEGPSNYQARFQPPSAETASNYQTRFQPPPPPHAFTSGDFISANVQPALGGVASLSTRPKTSRYTTPAVSQLSTTPKTIRTILPPTPQEQLNDVSSAFHDICIKDKTKIYEEIEKKVFEALNNGAKLEISDIKQKIPEHEINEINKALQSLLEKQRIQKFGSLYSLSFINDITAAMTFPKIIPESYDDFSSSDYSADIYDASSNFMNFGSAAAAAPTPVAPSFFVPGTARPLLLPEGKNAISMLNEYAQSNQLKIAYKEHMSGPDHKRQFSMTAILGGNSYKGPEAPTKKYAKLKAAEVALSVITNERSNDIPGTSAGPAYTTGLSKEATLHDKVAALVNQKYIELTRMLPDVITGRKIIAGFVMSRKIKSGEDLFEVVSIGSGNRCVMGDKLSMQGQTVNDCHAEVIARRGLVRFFYQKLLTEENDPVFIPSGDKYALAPGIDFHLYISTAPCGDSAIFAPSDANTDQGNQAGSDGVHHPVFENRKQGVLRTKLENGEGCIPIEEDTAAPTWDGILRGQRLRTMSCSDKIAKWNYLGLQGSLLSRFLKPVYMSSLTLGMLYNHSHLTRAVCCRVQKSIDSLETDLRPPTQYKVNHPMVSGQNQQRETGKVKTREFSVNWSFYDEHPEVLDGTEGRCENRFGSQNPPRICKAELFKEFKKICDWAEMPDLYKDGYYESKMSSYDYHNAKHLFWDALEQSGFGRWMSKPKEEKDF